MPIQSSFRNPPKEEEPKQIQNSCHNINPIRLTELSELSSVCIEARNGEYGGICLLDIQCLTFTHSKLLDKNFLCLFHSFSFTCSFSLKCCRCWGVSLSYTRFERVCEHICVSIHITHSETTKCSVLTVVRHNVCSLSIEHTALSQFTVRRKMWHGTFVVCAIFLW